MNVLFHDNELFTFAVIYIVHKDLNHVQVIVDKSLYRSLKIA